MIYDYNKNLIPFIVYGCFLSINYRKQKFDFSLHGNGLWFNEVWFGRKSNKDEKVEKVGHHKFL